jgi:hypothetical protein
MEVSCTVGFAQLHKIEVELMKWESCLGVACGRQHSASILKEPRVHSASALTRLCDALAASALSADVTKPDLAAVLSYTSKHLMRCYPSAWRMLDNSNPNPAGAWSYGISLAALNW